MGFVNSLFVRAAYGLKDRGAEIVYWTGAKSLFEEAKRDKKRFPDTVFHDMYDATSGIPAKEVDQRLFKPVGEELYTRMLPCESEVIPMMDSIDQDDDISVKERRNTYHEYVRYWYGVLSIYEPDAVLFHDVPHLAHNFVAYHLAQHMGIKTIMCDKMIRVPGRLMFSNEFRNFDRIKQEYDMLHNKKIEEKDLSVDIQTHYLNHKNGTVDMTPFFLKPRVFARARADFNIIPRPTILMKHLMRGTFLKTAIAYTKMLFNKQRTLSLHEDFRTVLQQKIRKAKWQRIQRSFQKEYEHLESRPDYSRKFVYVPLHSQPEMSTSALGGRFSDQILLVSTLSASLPEGWVIYVKEASLQWLFRRVQVGRYRGYYEKLARLSNVRLIPIKTSTYELITRCQAVATVTGTAGWEAILRGKPALFFGNIWFMHCEGAFKVRDVATCSAALEKIRNGYIPNKDMIIKFLAAFDKVTVRGFNMYDRKNGQTTVRDSDVAAMAESYWKELH